MKSLATVYVLEVSLGDSLWALNRKDRFHVGLFRRSFRIRSNDLWSIILDVQQKTSPVKGHQMEKSLELGAKYEY